MYPLLFLLAAALNIVAGAHQWPGVVLGPLGAGALGVACAWVAEPFAARRFLWAAAVLPGLQAFAMPGYAYYHTALPVLIVLTLGCVARAWHDNVTYGLLAGVSGAFAIWLAPETTPFVLMAFAGLLLRWLYVPLGKTITACAAGFFDVLSVALIIDPPQRGWGVPEIGRLSLVYVVLGMLLLAGAAGLWLLEARWRPKHARPLGVALMALLVAAWVAMFPKVAMAPHGATAAADMGEFFGPLQPVPPVQPVHGLLPLVYLAPGALALVYALWRAAARRPDGAPLPGRSRWLWLYIAACTAVALVLGAKFSLFVAFAPCAAAVLLPVALSEVSLRYALKAGWRL